MAAKIGFQTGLDAAAQRETELHPAYKAAWDKRTSTLKALVAGHNETQDRLDALEKVVGPFFP